MLPARLGHARAIPGRCPINLWQDSRCRCETEAKNVADVVGEAQAVEHGEEIKESFVVRVVNPTFDWDAVG